MASFDQRLDANGCALGSEEFKVVLMDVFNAFCPSWTVDELLCHPTDGLRFCTLVRDRTGCRDLPEDLILKILLNTRKSA